MLPSPVNHESSVNRIIGTVLAGAANKIALLVVVFHAFGQCSGYWYTSYSRTTRNTILWNMRSAAAMLLVLVTGYPAVSTRIVSPTTGFLIFFYLSRSAAAKEIFHLSPKVSINI
jgi:hypothetical protein